MPQAALVPLPLLLVDQEGFKAFLQALVDIPKLVQVFRFLGTRFAQVELHRKIDVCTQLHYISASCTELHCSYTVQSLCNRAGAAAATAAVVAAS